MFKFLKKDTAAYEYIIVCLGNPGDRYTTTRHNMGFLCGDYLGDKLGFQFKRIKFKANYALAEIGGVRVIVMKPQTYMNNSGEAVAQCASFYKIPPERIIVLVDDVNLEVGQLRIRRKGTDGGHNGIKSITQHLRTQQFPRIKMGVGKKPHPDYDLIDYVLSPLSREDMDKLPQLFEKVSEAVELMLNGKTDEAMCRFNS